MTERFLKLSAIVALASKADWPSAHKIGVGSWPNLFFSGKFFPAKIVQTEGDIFPGSRATAILMMIDSKRDPSGIRPGDQFELREGPAVVIATCEAVSVEEVQD